MSKQPPTLNPVLRSFWTTKARNKVLYGGRDSSKTWDAAGFAIYLASKYKLRFLCTRQFQNKIEESVYTTLKNQIDRFGLIDEFTILNNKITHDVTGSEFIFYGLWRNIDEIKSLEGIDVCWIEEAHNLTKDQWDTLEPTLRKESSEFWIIFNPKLVTDFTYQRFVINPPPNTLVRKINYHDNPFLSSTSLSVIKARRDEDYEEYMHIYEGEPRQDDNDSIIKRAWVLSAIDSHIKLGVDIIDRHHIGFDVADDGADKNCYCVRKGFLLTEVHEWKAGEDELVLSASKVYSKAIELNCAINYDSIGVGAFMGSKFKELNRNKIQGMDIEYYKFNAAEKVKNPDKEYNNTGIKNKDFFCNIKAQAWWEIADRFRATYNAVTKGDKILDDMLISIDSNIEDLESLINELTTPRKDYDNMQRVKVESKKDLKQRKIASPNKADAFIMAYFDVKTVNPLVAAMRS